MQTEQLPAVEIISTRKEGSSSSGHRQAQKRVAIGLSPRRPTARTVIQRPPTTGLTRWQQWLITSLVVALMGATVLLIVAKTTGASTAWPQVRRQLITWISGQSLPATTLADPGAGYQLQLETSFIQPTDAIASSEEAGQWTAAILPDQGLYRFQLWPGRLAWSTLALDDLAHYWLEASFTIAEVMPEGYTGFLGRYQDTQNFYLFAFNGTGDYQVLLWQAGQLTTLQPWTSSAVINPAGYENVAAIEDDGQVVHFYVNKQLLFTVQQPQLTVGSTGLVGGAGDRTMAEITIDWLRLYGRAQ